IPHFEKSFLGNSQKTKTFFEETSQAISSGNNLLIYGKSGDEVKDLVTFIYLFKNLPYEVPLIELDCALVTLDEFEPEAFGHFKRIVNNRYITNQGKERIGKREQANQGFLFINNIDQLSISNQEVLFSALKNGYITPGGGFLKEHRVDIDFTLIAGSARN